MNIKKKGKLIISSIILIVMVIASVITLLLSRKTEQSNLALLEGTKYNAGGGLTVTWDPDCWDFKTAKAAKMTIGNSYYDVFCAYVDSYIGYKTKSTTVSNENFWSKTSLLNQVSGYNQNKVRWLVDNFYLPFGVSDSRITNLQKNNLINVLINYGGKSRTEATNIVNALNSYQIYDVEQNILWGFINGYDYGSGYNSNMQALYNAFWQGGHNNGSYSSIGTNSVSIDKSKATIYSDGVIGPFTINGNGKIYNISTSVTFNGTTTSKTLYKDRSCKTPVNSYDNYYGDVYINLNTSLSAGKKYTASVSFSGAYYNTSALYWQTTNSRSSGGQIYQPLLSLSREYKTFSQSYSGEYSQPANGSYNIRISKKATTGGSGTATFNIKQYLSNSKTVTREFNPVLTAGNSITSLAGNITVSDTKSDTYIIKETATTGNLAIGFTDTLKIVVNKECKDNLKYKFKSYNIYINDEPVFDNELTAGCSIGSKIKVDIDHTNAYITVTFTNPTKTGSYQMSYVKKSTESTTSIDDVSDAVPGAIFGVTTKLNDASTGSTENITTQEGKEVTREYTITNTSKVDVYEIREIQAPQGYLKGRLLNDCYIMLIVTKGETDDKYVVEKVFAKLINTSTGGIITSGYLEKDTEFEFMNGLAEGIRLKFTSEKVTVELSDPPVEPFNFTLQKKSAEDTQEFLQNTDMTIKRTVKKGSAIIGNAEEIIHNGTFVDGEAKFIYPEDDIDIDYTYYYDIYENNAQSPYKNILGKNMFLRVSIKMDEQGELSASIEVKGVDGYVPTQSEIDEVMKYVDEPFVNPDTRNISLIVKNPKDTIPVNLQLFKHQLDNKNSPVKDAIYSVKEIDENGNKISDLPTIRTNTANKTIVNIPEGEIGKSYYYELIEETVPENYVNVISGARVKIEISAEGTVSSSIIKVKQKDSDVWEDYNNTFEKHVSISNPDANNNIVLYMANSVKFDFTLYKKNYASNTDLEQAENFNGTATFKIEQIIGNQTEEKFNGTLADAKAFFDEDEASANSTYTYRITETYVSDDFYDTLVNVPIILKIRTDDKGKVKPESFGGSNWEFDSTAGLSASQIELMSSLIDLDIPEENNQVKLYIANMPKNYYSLQLVKVDKNGKTIKLENATFEFGMETNNPDGEGIDTNQQDTKEGILNIASGCIIDPGYTHTYTIKETQAPAGYTKLEGTVQLATKFTDDGKLLNENISLKYTNADGIEETIEGLKFVYNDDSEIPIIQVYIPNDSKLFEFELIKEDLKGNKITAEELENGNIDGAHFYISRTTVTQVPGTTTNVTDSNFFEGTVINDVLEDGTVNDIVPAFTNLQYFYQIQETSSKSGYVNIFDRYIMNLNITTDDEAKISSADYQIIDILNHGSDATNTFKEKYGELVEVKLNDTKDKVTILIKNTYGYKVRLNKINTSGTPIEATVEAYLDAYNKEQNSYYFGDNRKCAINGTYSIPGTNESYKVTGETTHLSEEYIMAGETQIWTIVERAANTPYYNVFENKYIDVEVEMNEQYELVVKGYTIRDSETREEVSQEELENLNKYIEDIEFVMEDDVHVLNITLKNPVKYRFKLTKYDADGTTELKGAVLTVNGKEVINNGESYYEVDNITDIGKTFTFVIRETSTIKNHINILGEHDRYLTVIARVLEDGNINILSSSVSEHYNGNPKPWQIPSYDEIYDYINVTPSKDSDGIPVINVGILNPLQYEFEVKKVDTSDEKDPLANTQFEIYSPVVAEQNGRYKYSINKEGVTSMSNSGTIYGVTTEEGKILFGEQNIQVGKTYEYKITEIDTASDAYENMFKEYSIYVKAKLDTTGAVTLENYENGKNCEIRKDDGTKAPDSYYDYVTVNVDNTGDKPCIKVEVENPTKIKLKINKKIFGEEEINLANTTFEVVSEISGTKELPTDKDGNIVLDETPVKEGIYEYIIREKETSSKDIINILSDNYIKFRLYVSADGSIYTVDSEGQRADNTYYLYKADNTLLNFDNTNIDTYVSIDTTGKIDNTSTVEVKVLDPQKYDLTILKKDKDTNKPMNNVTFDITVFEQGETETEIKLKDANTMQDKNLLGLKTSNVNGQDGVISINDILFEKAGTYKLRLHETPVESYINIGDVEVYVTVEVVDGKYEVTNINYENEFIDEENTKIVKEEGKDIINVQIAVENEEIKGSYDLIINKTDLRGNYLDGAEVRMTVLRNGRESELYEANDDVTSKNVVIPAQAKIENGSLTISNIRIEKPESYTIKIEEIKAPETYVKLEKPVEIKVTTKIEGEGLNARYVLESATLVDNNEFVELDPSENKVEVTIKNEQFDLALRKFITKITTNEGKENERVQDITNRVPEVDTQYLQNGMARTAIYNHTKDPISLYAGDTVIYTIRVYNEADIAGYAEEVTDHLPEYLEFVNDEFNSKYGWLLDESDTSLRTVKTNYLSRARDEKGNLIKAFNKETGELDYKELQIKCKVKENTPASLKLTNIAEISKYVGENGREVTDRDSEAGNVVLPEDSNLPSYKDEDIENDIEYIPGQQDDDDFEKVLIEEFDLALRKFITGVTNGYGDKQEVTTRIPVFKVDENGNYVYEHTKEPVLVANQNVVEYTIRVYNEGTVNGYAKEIKDDIPEGLEFLPDDETNKEYRWIMLDEEGNETDEVSEAKYIVTDYLSKENEETDGENLLKAFDEEAYEAGSIKEPDYKEVKVAFKVTMPNTSDEIIINQAQISDDSDEDGNEVTDKDSTPNEWIDGEDDQDIEKIKVQYFDLALRKWVTKAIVIENGVETITETGHKAEDDPEAVVKVDLKKSKLDKVVVKFEYQIRVTNEGEIAGSVEEISDYIPQGLKFVAADNPEWEEVEGKVVTDQLAGQIIQPGESKEVTILLTWINREDNMGLKVNVAEISKDYNEYGSPDIDSTPNNQVPGEDDIDDAPVMLTVTTGQAVMYIGITIAVLGILAGGVIGIKKFVIK